MIEQNKIFFFIFIIKLESDVNLVSESGHWVNVSTSGSSVKHDQINFKIFNSENYKLS